MRAQDLTEWMQHPATKALVALLRKEMNPVLKEFKAGLPADPVRQGLAVAYSRLEDLLTNDPQEIAKKFDEAIKAQHDEQRRHSRV